MNILNFLNPENGSLFWHKRYIKIYIYLNDNDGMWKVKLFVSKSFTGSNLAAFIDGYIPAITPTKILANTIANEIGRL